MKRLLLVFTVGSALMMGACSKEKSTCEDLYERIAKCMPNLAGDREMHVSLCEARFDKDATKASIKCMKTTRDCAGFKACLKAAYSKDKDSTASPAAPAARPAPAMKPAAMKPAGMPAPMAKPSSMSSADKKNRKK